MRASDTTSGRKAPVGWVRGEGVARYGHADGAAHDVGHHAGALRVRRHQVHHHRVVVERPAEGARRHTISLAASLRGARGLRRNVRVYGHIRQTQGDYHPGRRGY
jgi:hypothetical protein